MKKLKNEKIKINKRSFEFNYEKIMVKKKSYWFIIFSLFHLFIFLFTACLSPNQGCTDVNATNFDVTASKQISPNNCVYPKLIVQMFPYWDTTALSSTTIYAISPSDTFRVLSAQMYFSNVKLLDDNQNSVPITDSLLIYRSNDSLNIPNNIFLNKTNTVEYSLFSINTSQNFSHFQMTVGLDATSQQAVPSRNPSGNPLTVQNISMYDTTNSRYYLQSITISRLNQGDTITIYGQQTVPFDFKIDTKNQKGFSLAIPLKVDYKKLLANVATFKTDNATLQKNVWSNIFRSITLLQK